MTHSYKYKVCRVLFLLFTPQSPCRQIVGKELFSVLREKHGAAFQSLVQEKVSPLAGDMTHEGLGLESTRAKQLAEEVDIIVNGAAITNFCERYTSVTWNVVQCPRFRYRTGNVDPVSGTRVHFRSNSVKSL